MNEEFLHYIWKYRLFNKPLFTVEGERVEILTPGIHNFNAGPDFSDARLKIGTALWAGNVEIHIHTSDWMKHKHQNDPAYDNVVLHVVFTHDAPEEKYHIPVLELKGSFDENLFIRYRKFINNRLWVPCAKLIKTVPEIDISLWLERMLIERLERKADLIAGFLELGKNNWEEALYYTLARSFGFHVNALPFEMLARSLPYKIIARHADNPFQVEALVFGQSGLLTEEVTDRYAQDLFNEYVFLRKKYHLVPIAGHLWKFLRLRPANFPTIRLSQFANFLSANRQLLSRILQIKKVEGFMDIFMDIKPSAYWNDHYIWDKKAAPRQKSLGKDAVNLLMINALLPFLFVYGRAFDDDKICNRALDFFTKIPGEKNSITINWQKTGMDIASAFQTQALISLKSEYCDKKRCLQCRIGNYLLKQNKDLTADD